MGPRSHDTRSLLEKFGNGSIKLLGCFLEAWGVTVHSKWSGNARTIMANDGGREQKAKWSGHVRVDILYNARKHAYTWELAEPLYCCQGLGFYFSYKLINHPVIVSWILVIHETPESETKDFITAQHASSMSSIFTSVPLAPQFPRGRCGGSRWIPVCSGACCRRLLSLGNLPFLQ